MNFGETEVVGCHEDTHKKKLLGSVVLLLLKLISCSNTVFLNYFIYTERHHLCPKAFGESIKFYSLQPTNCVLP
jgi:hypothetical protein